MKEFTDFLCKRFCSFFMYSFFTVILSSLEVLQHDRKCVELFSRNFLFKVR